MVGAYALQNSMFDVYIAMVFGVIGYFLRRYEFPLGPFLLAIVLGSIIEYNLMTALQISKGNWLDLFTRSISGTLLGITAAFLIMRVYKIRKANKKEKQSTEMT